jgi:competence protein ComEC
MVSVAMLTRSLGRRPNALRCFSLSLLGANLVEPLAIYDASFALSLTATAGLAFSARIQVSRIWRPLLATTAAMLACAPVLLYLAPELPLVSVAANLLAAPIGEMAALPLCLLHTVSWCFPALESGLALLASGALWVVRAIAHGASETGASLPLPPPTASQLAVLALTALFLHGARRRCRKPVLLVATLALLLAEWCAIKQGSPRGALRITVLDVGQGDAILIDLPDGTLMLLDAGPGETLGGHGGRVVRAALRKRRRSRIDILALSHPHPDHYGGMADVSAVVPIGAYWSPQIVRPDRRGRPLQKWLDSLRQGETRWMGPRQLCGQNHHFGEAVVEVLAPCPDVTGHAKVNDNSLIIRIRFGAHAALLMGDAEAEQEQRLLATKRQLRSDFLKVGHHGSRTSTNPALLAVIKPHHAAISCGVRNRFGHPHPQTLRTLSQIDTWRTDDHGATIWQSDGQTVTSGPAR